MPLYNTLIYRQLYNRLAQK